MYPEETAFNAELSYFQKYFTQNNFTANLVSKMFQKVIHKIYNPNPKCLSAEKKPMYFHHPYFGNASLEIKRKFKLIISRFYPHIQLRSVFTYKFTMSSLFRFVGNGNSRAAKTGQSIGWFKGANYLKMGQIIIFCLLG